MSRQKIGWRKKSTQANQYRVGRYGLTPAAASSSTSTWLVTSTASAPNPAPSDESVSVDRNSAIAATPSMHTVMNPTVASTRSTSWVRLIGAPDSEVTPPSSASASGGAVPSSTTPAAYEVPTIAAIASRTNTASVSSLATSSRVRPTGRASRYRRVPVPASPATASPASTATATGRKIGSTIAIAAAGYSDPLLSTADRNAGPRPGGGARWVVARNTPTVTQVRGRRSSLTSSTRITARPRSGRRWSW